ncbi:MAG: hypothetical protein HOP08_17470 [Cyclobacteriaceae bacterium]|nr:hypothetical protein [Cyclobacteriaceae bacterium]
MSLRRGGIFIVLSLLYFHSAAQESATQDTNVPGIKWYQINTPNFRVLYPKGFEDQAQRVANNLETIREPEAKSMGTLPKKMSIILQSNSSVSNGFVTFAPKRSEFYTMPSQNYNFAGTNDWLNLLSSHEYRHMVQFQRSITGFNKLLYFVFGQQATAGMAFAAVPQWFWEGDAVATETAFTPSGRGRIPNFDLLFKTNIMEGRTFNYHKQYLRSYKNAIPDHYVLGYNMVSYLRKKTNDPLIWEKVVGRSWDVPFIPFAFSNSLKKETGSYVKDLYLEMAQQRKKEYEAAINAFQPTAFESVNKRKSEAYTDYSFPQLLDDGTILVTKSGIGDIDQLVKLDANGNELKKYVQGQINASGMLSAANQRVVWNEFRYDPRWSVHTYSVIKGYDFGDKDANVISDHSRYSSAALSPDGYQVATVQTTEEYKITIVVLDYYSGKVLKEFANPTNDLLSMPRWTPDGKSIIALRANTNGKTITRFKIEDGSSSDLIPFSQENVGYPIAFGNYILFNSPLSGIDNIYAINPDTQEKFQITASKYGAYNPFVSKDGKTIYYNDQTRNGLDVVKIPFDPASWKKVEATQPAPNSYQHLVDQEGRPDLFKSITQTKFESKRYHRASGMINPHSWGPYFLNSLTNIRLGILSQDILSTTRIDAGYIFDLNERTGTWKAGVSYQGKFPILDLSVSQSTRSVDEGTAETWVINGTDTSFVDRNVKFTWKEKNVEGGFRIPLTTTSSKYFGNVTLGNSVGYTNVTEFSNSINDTRVIPAVTINGAVLGAYQFYSYIGNGNLIYNHFTLSAYRLMKQSRRDINSRWGQTFNLGFYNTPFGGDFTGSQASFTTQLYFPGFFKHHSIWGYWAFQRNELNPLALDRNGKGIIDNSDYYFRNQIPLPRGQSVARFQDFYSMSVNYTMPVWYPDIAIGPLLNIQRVRATGFLDYGYGRSKFGNNDAVSRSYTSVGGEVKFDINVLRFLPQFNIGFRYSYGLDPRVTRYEILVGTFNF